MADFLPAEKRSVLGLASKGLTFIELILAVVILGVLIAVGAPSMHELIAKRRVQAAADELITDLRLARSIVIEGNKQAQFRFYFDDSSACYIISDVTEDVDDCDCLSGRSPVCTAQFREHKTVRFPASDSVRLRQISGHHRILIESMQGRPDRNRMFDIRVSSTHGGALRVKTNETFLPSVCSETGHVGYPRCAFPE